MIEFTPGKKELKALAKLINVSHKDILGGLSIQIERNDYVRLENGDIILPKIHHVKIEFDVKIGDDIPFRYGT